MEDQPTTVRDFHPSLTGIYKSLCSSSMSGRGGSFATAAWIMPCMMARFSCGVSAAAGIDADAVVVSAMLSKRWTIALMEGSQCLFCRW